MESDLNSELTKNFIQSLHTEKFRKQEFIQTLIKDKLAFTTGIFTAANIDIKNLSFYWLFLFIPFLIIIYDHYILTTYYSIVKIGSFLRNNSCEIERLWEEKVSTKREQTLLSIYISFGASFVITIITIWFIYLKRKPILNISSYVLWFIILAACWVFVFCVSLRNIRNLDTSKKQKDECDYSSVRVQ